LNSIVLSLFLKFISFSQIIILQYGVLKIRKVINSK